MTRSVAHGKQVKVGHLKLDFYLSVVDNIRKLGKLPEGGRSKQARNWFVKRLLREGVVRKIGYGVWEVNEQKWINFRASKQVKVQTSIGHDDTPRMSSSTFTFHVQSRGVRGHGFQFILKIPFLKNWDRRVDFLKAKQVSFKPTGSFRKGQRVIIGGFKVWLCQKSVIIYFPESMDILEETARISKEMAFLKVLEVIREVEEVMQVSFKVAGHYQIRLVKQHYADPNNSLAKRFLAEGKKLEVKGIDGKTWLLVDCSTGIPELETVHPVQAAGDMDDVVKRFFEELKTNPVFPKEIMSMNQAMTMNIAALTNLIKKIMEEK